MTPPKPQPSDSALYARVVADATARFAAPTSVYRSAWIVREYRKRGGTYRSPNRDVGSHSRGAKAPPLTGLRRWFREDWRDVNRPGQPCGRPSSSAASTPSPYPLCRPTRRVSPQTPRTLAELDPRAVAAANRVKQRVRETGRVRFGAPAAAGQPPRHQRKRG